MTGITDLSYNHFCVVLASWMVNCLLYPIKALSYHKQVFHNYVSVLRLVNLSLNPNNYPSVCTCDFY